MVKRFLDCVVFVACVAVAGCGSGANKKGSGGNGGGGGGAGGVSGGSCSLPPPCGGNLAGTWRLGSGCGSITLDTCTSQPIDFETSWGDATYTFANDGTFTSTFSGTVSEAIRYPIACVAPIVDAGATEACADFQNAVQMGIQNADGGATSTSLTSFTCSMASGTICLCNEIFSAVAPQAQTGMYTTSGNQLTITGGADAGSSSSHADYCVSGSTLTMRLTDTSSSTANEFQLTLSRVN